MDRQRVIPAISSHKKLKEFLESDLVYGILMNFQLAQLEELVKTMKSYQKKVLIHSELIKGLASDEYGAIYLIQVLNVDGIISSKPKVIEVCKKRGVLGIYRFFIKDTISLEQSLDIGRRLRPEYVEILPAACYELIGDIKKDLNAKVLMGGLIRNKEQAECCFKQGAIAITASNPELWLLN
ncbi:MAG: glycerol-3-phosphate responsive antiterminator [Candidatus Izemoplasmatales bacterium]|nr:glycerol-3-phosphate responsive antiterminator [Candidatus Izemoplasmatales bacterium]